MRKEFYKYLNKLFREDPRIVILLGDIGVHSLKPAFDFDKSRIYNLGIMEQSIIGTACGLAKSGFIPFIHSIAPFITERCYEQLKLNLGYEKVNAFVVSIGAAYDYAALGCTHHCHNDLRIISSIPNFNTFCPGNSRDVEQIIESNLDLECPKYIRLAEEENNLQKVLSYSTNFEFLHTGNNGICLIVGNAIKDIREFIIHTPNIGIIYTYDISEFDTQRFKNIIENFHIRKRITVVEPCYDSGIVSKIATSIDGFEFIRHISLPKMFVDDYGTKQEIDQKLGMDDLSIINKLHEIYK